MTTRRCFGNQALDIEARELLRDGVAIDIEPKAFELLVLLANRPDHTFSKDEIAASLWPDRVISDSVIAQAVRKARQATGDTTSAQQVIKTVHGVGYRFTAELTEPDTPSVGIPALDRRRSLWGRARPALWALTGLLVMALVAWLPSRQTSEVSTLRVTIAALPGTESGALGESLSAGLESLLSRGVAEHSDIQIVTSNRTQRMLYALGLDQAGDNEVLLTALNDSLGADYLLRSHVEQDETGYRLHADLIGPGGIIRRIEPPAGDIVTMVRGFSLALAKELDHNWQIADGIPILSDDDFVNQAYVRALNALLAGENQTAALLFESVLTLDQALVYARYELGNALWQMGKHDQARSNYQQSLAAALEHQESRLAGHAASMLGVLDWQAGHLDQAEIRYQEALSHYELIDEHHGAASSLGNLGNLADSRGDLDTAADLHLLARERFRAANDQVGESATFTNLAVISRQRNRIHEAHRFQSTAIDLQRQLGIGSMLVRSLTYQAGLECQLGQCEPAIELLDEAQRMAEEQENRAGLADIALERARIALSMLQPATASERASEAYTDFGGLDMPSGQILALSVLAEAALLLDDPEQAGQWLDQADQLDQNISKPNDRAERSLLRARVYLANSEESTLEGLLATLRRDTNGVVAARALALQAELEWARASHAEALEKWRAALEELESFDDPGLRAGVRLRIASGLIDQGQIDEAETQLARVRDWSARDAGVRLQQARLYLARAEFDHSRQLLEELAATTELPLGSQLHQSLAALTR